MEATEFTAGAPTIEAKGLSKYFGPFVAVRDISFSIPKGQIVAFLGPNGAGKTTMMRMLTGFLAPSAGSASIAGLDVREHRIEASRHLGYLPENGPLLSGHDSPRAAHLLRRGARAREGPQEAYRHGRRPVRRCSS